MDTLKNVFGYIFIAIGVIVIAATIFNAVQMFSGEKEFPQVFSSDEAMPTQNGDSSSGGLDSIVEGLISDQINSILPENSVENTLNMTAWIIFAFFMVYAGGKIADIGFKFLKKE